MWCCSKSSAPSSATNMRRKPTLTGRTMLVLTQAHMKWLAVQRRLVWTWKTVSAGKRMKIERLVQVLSRFRQDQSVALGWETLVNVAHRLTALPKSLQLYEKNRLFSAFRSWKRSNFHIKRNLLLYKLSFSSLKNLFSQHKKTTLRRKIALWNAISNQKKTKVEENLLKGGIKLAAFFTIKQQISTLNTIFDILKRFKGAKRLFCGLTSIENREMQRIIRIWKEKTKKNTHEIKLKTVEKLMKMLSILRAFQKDEKRGILRKLAKIANFKCISKSFFEGKNRKITKNCAFLRQEALRKPIISSENAFFNPISQNFSHKSSIKTALNTFFTHFSRKPGEMIRKWRELTRENVPEMALKLKLFERFGKISLKTGLKSGFERWKNEKQENMHRKCLKRIIYYGKFRLMRLFSTWKNTKIAKLREIRAQIPFIPPKIISISKENNTKISLNFLSFVIRKQLEVHFSLWRTEIAHRNTQEIVKIKQIQELKRFILTKNVKILRNGFGKYREKVKIWSIGRKYLGKMLKKDAKMRKIEVICVWKSSVSVQKRYLRFTSHFTSLEKLHISPIFSRFSSLLPRKIRRQMRKAKSYSKEASELV